MPHKLVLIILLGLGTFTGSAQNKEQDIKDLIYHNDSLFWIAYNNCDVPGMSSWMTDDVEFYHDKGGATKGRDTIIALLKKNLCSNSQYGLRREPVKGTVNVYVLNSSDVPYGAIITGQHVFYVRQNGQKEFLDGLARFSQLWILNNGSWKMSRILSYDHGPAPQNMDRTEKKLPSKVLNSYVGKYKSPNYTMEAVNNHDTLKLLVDGKEYVLLASSETEFFTKGRDLEFIITPKKLTVKEHGQVVEQADKL